MATLHDELQSYSTMLDTIGKLESRKERMDALNDFVPQYQEWKSKNLTDLEVNFHDEVLALDNKIKSLNMNHSDPEVSKMNIQQTGKSSLNTYQWRYTDNGAEIKSGSNTVIFDVKNLSIENIYNYGVTVIVAGPNSAKSMFLSSVMAMRIHEGTHCFVPAGERYPFATQVGKHALIDALVKYPTIDNFYVDSMQIDLLRVEKPYGLAERGISKSFIADLNALNILGMTIEKKFVIVVTTAALDDKQSEILTRELVGNVNEVIMIRGYEKEIATNAKLSFKFNLSVSHFGISRDFVDMTLQSSHGVNLIKASIKSIKNTDSSYGEVYEEDVEPFTANYAKLNHSSIMAQLHSGSNILDPRTGFVQDALVRTHKRHE